MPRPALSQVTSHQNDLTHRNRLWGRTDSRSGTMVDESAFHRIRQITQADELAVVVANPTQRDVRVIWLVSDGKP